MKGRETLERRQVWFYLAAVALGLLVGIRWPQSGHLTETLVWPVLALLLYATFTQLPLAAIPTAFKDGRFLATALTPITLILQLALLPLYLLLLTDVDFAIVFAPADIWPAVLVVLAPLVLAALTELWATKNPSRQRTVQSVGWWPVPLLAVVLLLVATAHVGAVGDTLHLLPVVVGIAVAFLGASLVIAKLLSCAARLPTEQGRTLAFSMSTRNSFIVLPVALSLPAGWEVAAVVIVMQSLVELFAMVFFLWFVPRVLFKGPAHNLTTPQH